MLSRLAGNGNRGLGLFKARIERSVRLTGDNYRLARKLLLLTTRILDDADIPYHLEGGTLLGMVRDGDILPWDYDLDISIMAPDVSRLKKQLWRFPLHGYYVSRRYAHKASPAWDKGALRIVKLRNRRVWFFKGDIRLDIIIKYDNGDATYWTIVKKLCKVDTKFYRGYDELNYQGTRLKTPRLKEEYLVCKYGDDWQTPKKDFINKRDDQTIQRDL